MNFASHAHELTGLVVLLSIIVWLVALGLHTIDIEQYPSAETTEKLAIDIIELISFSFFLLLAIFYPSELPTFPGFIEIFRISSFLAAVHFYSHIKQLLRKSKEDAAKSKRKLPIS